MDPFFGQGDIGSLFGRSSSRSGFHGDMFEEPPGSPSHSGSPSGMELAPLYSSSSGHLGGRESITDILRRYQGPPRSESFGGFEDDYEENEESHVNFDAHGAHIGARVSRTQQTPFGPISCGASMQMSIGRGGVSIRTTSSASLAGGGHGRTMLMSLSMGSQRHHSCGGMGGGLFGPFGGMFSPFGGLMPPFGGMFALGSGSFDHMSPHAMEDIFEGRGRSSDNYSGPIIEEMEEDDYTQLALTDKSDQRANEKEIDASLGLGLLASTEESDDECTTPSTTDAETGMILNESILVSKRSNLPVTSDFPEQTSLENMNDNIVTDEKIHNETKNYPMYGKSSSPILGLHPKDSIPQEDTDTSFGDEDLPSFDGKTDMFQNYSTNFVKSPTTIPDEFSEIIETSLSQDDMFPSLNEITVQKDTLDTSRNLGFDMDLPQADTEKPKEKESTSDEEDSHNASGQYSSNNIMPSTHMSSKNQDYSIFHTDLDDERIYNSSVQKEKMTPDFKLQSASPRNKKFTKLKFNDVKFGFGDREASFSHNSTELSTLQLPDKEYKNPEKENVLPNDANKEKAKICQVVQEIVFSENRQDLLKPEEHCEQNAQSHPGQLIEPGQQEQASPLDELIVQNAEGRRGQPGEVGGLGQLDEQELDQPNYRGQPDEPPAATEQCDTDQPDPEQLVTEQSFTSKHLISTKNNSSAGSKFSSRRNELSYRPQDSDLNAIREGTDTPINRTHALPKCKHLHTHIHGCCHSYYLHCNDCGMHFHRPEEINAIEAATKHEDEIFNHPEWQFLKEFSVDYGTSAMSGTKKPRNKNAIPRPTTAEGIDKTNEHSCCKHARPKSATGPELSTLVESIGLTLKDVYPDGNCLFTSVVDQLRIRGDFSYTSRDLRHAAVDYLEANPNQDDGTPLSAFLTGYERNWETYLSSMRHEGHWGDHHTIWALANVLKKKIVIYRGDKELHRTLVEPSRANHEKSADNEDIDKEKPKDKEDVESILDVEEMHLGHISESHYVSLRPANWHEQLMTILKTKHSPAIVGCNPDSKRLDLLQLDIPSIHFNFAMKYILLSEQLFSNKDINDETEEDRHPQLSSKWASRLEIYSPLIDKMNCMVLGTSSKQITQTDKAMMAFNIPLDTKVFNKRSKMAGRKDLIAYSDKLKPGCTKLRTVDRTVWMGSTDKEQFLRHIFLKMQVQPFLSTSRNEKQILLAFQSEWPVAASEWTNRNRPYGWPSKVVVDRVVSMSGRVVPSVHQVHDSSSSDEKHGTANEKVNNSESSTDWKYVFDHAERIIVDEALTEQQLEIFHIIKVFMDHVLADSKLPLSLLKNLFFYMCEETDCAVWTIDPAKCLLAFLDRLYRCLKLRFVPSYFLPEVNLLEIKTERELNGMLDRLKVASDNPFMTLYFTFDHISQNLISTLFDRLVEDARRYVPDCDTETSVRTCFIPLVSDGISLLIARKKFGTALDRCRKAALYLEAITRGSVQVSLENIVTKSLYRNVPPLERWLFAFYVDQVIGTDMTEAICEGQATASLSDVFGSSLDNHLRLSANNILIPIEIISLDALAETAAQLFVVLRGEFKIPIYAFEEAASFFLKHHMPRLIKYARTKKDGRLELLLQTLSKTVIQPSFWKSQHPI